MMAFDADERTYVADQIEKAILHHEVSDREQREEIAASLAMMGSKQDAAVKSLTSIMERLEGYSSRIRRLENACYVGLGIWITVKGLLAIFPGLKP